MYVCSIGSNSRDNSRFWVIVYLELLTESRGENDLKIMQLYEIETQEMIPCFSQPLSLALKAHNSLADQADRVQKMNPCDHFRMPIFGWFLHEVQLLQLLMT